MTAAAIQQAEIPGLRGHWKSTVEGGFRHISVAQLAMTWHLYRQKHLNARQFRMVFALHEQKQRRDAAKSPQNRPRRLETPAYGLVELRRLIGCRDAEKVSDGVLRRDLARLASLGLVQAKAHTISFATSPDQLTVEDLDSYWAFFRGLPNSRRRIAVPRRTLRALAGGFTRATAGVILALLIRGQFGHRAANGYRTDGRVKRSWIAEVFGLGLSTVKEARSQLIKRAWITELPTNQWEKNKWGMHYVIDVDYTWSPPEVPEAENTQDQAAGQGGSTDPATPSGGVSGPPQPANDAKSGPPCLNSSPSLREELNNSNPTTGGGPAVVSGKKDFKKTQPPRLHDIQPEDLTTFDRLDELHRQAIDQGKAKPGEWGRKEFFALAHRAKAKGTKPVRLFAAMLRDQRFAWITDSDEDEAHQLIKRHTLGVDHRRKQTHDADGIPLYTPKVKRTSWEDLSDDAKFVARCRNAVKGSRHDPFRLAQRAEKWTRDRWEAAEHELDLREWQ